MELYLSEVYRLFGRKMAGRDLKLTGVAVDTRVMKKGSLFFALKGEVTDGHRFIKKALAKSAAAVVCEKGTGKKLIKVKSTKNALLKLAGYYAGKFPSMKIAGITGSNGKTTVKELLAAMASGKYRVVKNIKSYNNYVGMPLTVFRAGRRTGLLIAELGMNKKGEIKKLARCLSMDVGVINNIGRAHIGFFKGVRGIAEAKAEIISGIKKNGTIVLNRDDKFYGYLKKKARSIDVVSFGRNTGSNVKIKGIKAYRNAAEFTLATKGKNIRIRTKLKGIHNVYNATAAAAAACALGVKTVEIKKALKSFNMKGFMRFEEKKVKGASVINDCYNANPDSFGAAVETLRQSGYRRLYAVTGDMLEQGKETARAHEEIGRKMEQLKLKKLYIYGKNADYVLKGFVSAGGNRQICELFSDKSELKKKVKSILKPGNTVFIKGSRANRLEETVKGI